MADPLDQFMGDEDVVEVEGMQFTKAAPTDQKYCECPNDHSDGTATCQHCFLPINNSALIASSERRVGERREEINHPYHYNQGSIEVIDAIEDWKLGFNLGNAVKYIARAKAKGQEEKDIRKAIWYLQRHLGENKK